MVKLILLEGSIHDPDGLRVHGVTGEREDLIDIPNL